MIRKVWRAFDGLASDTLWSGGHDLLALVAALTSFKLLQTVFTDPAEYGAYFGLYGLVGTFGAMAFSGVGLALLQRLLGERDEPNGALKSFLSLGLVLAVGSALLTFILAFFTITFSPLELVLVITAELVAMSLISISSILIQAGAGFAAAIRVRLGVIILRLAVLLSLYSTGNLSLRTLASGFLITFSVYAAFLLIFHLPRHGYAVRFGKPTSMAVRASAMFSAPMGASKLQTDADKWFLNVFRFQDAAGLYGAAYRILQLGILPLLALDTAAFQRFLPKGEGERGLHWRRSIRLGSLMLPASIVVAVAIYFFLPLLDFLFEEQYKDATDIVPWLLVLIPLIATSNTPLNGLLGLGRADKRMQVYLLSAGVSVTAYLALIPTFDWRGAFVASLFSEIVLAILGWGALWYYQRQADDELDRRRDSDPSLSTAG